MSKELQLQCYWHDHVPSDKGAPHPDAPPDTTFLALLCTLLSHHLLPCCQTADEDLSVDNPAAVLEK